MLNIHLSRWMNMQFICFDETGCKTWAHMANKQKWILAYLYFLALYIHRVHMPPKKTYLSQDNKTSTDDNTELNDGELQQCSRKRIHTASGGPRLKHARYHDENDEDMGMGKRKTLSQHIYTISLRFWRRHRTRLRWSAYK